ncbi:MAG: hypothetical protein L0229_14825, partial [Blastocatellia bacterium]|nr:hypothetical protein [Blastocatellia bacterium]
QGREQGIQQGEAEGFRKALHLIVSKRFPNLDVDEEISRIRDFAVLQQLCEEAMDAPDAASFKKRLADQKA